MVYRIKMLPAEQGDCLWIEYGDAKSPHRILIDGGTKKTYPHIKEELERIPRNQRNFELLVITHVDRDHIEGIIELLSENGTGVSFNDIWFNGWRHLPSSSFEDFGPVDGEKLTSFLVDNSLPWNKKFNGKSVSRTANGDLPTCELSGGMKITILSPDATNLETLRPVWEEKCQKAGLDPGIIPEESIIPADGLEVFGVEIPDVSKLSASVFESDDSEANGSSIAFLAECEGKCVLFAGDSFSTVLEESIKRLPRKYLVGPGNHLKLDAFKLPHHGSKANISRNLLERIDCCRYLFSTNGKIYRHPDREAVARVIKFGGKHSELIFNYRTKSNEIWDDNLLKLEHEYATFYNQGNSNQSIEF